MTPMMWTIALPLLAGFAAVYLLLPRPQPLPRLAGVAAAALALLLGGFLLVHTNGWTPENILFYLFAGIAVLSGGLLITQSNPARAALSFALVVLSTCGLFLLQAAPFLMAATTIIYAGAIIVTFLFVLMLAHQEGRSDADQRSREPFLASLAGFVLLGALFYVLQLTYRHPDTAAVLAGLESELQRAADVTSMPTPEEVVKGLDWDHFFQRLLERNPAEKRPALKEVRQEPRFAVLEERINTLEERWLEDLKGQPAADKARFLKSAVDDLQTEVAKARLTLGDLMPGKNAPLSEFSGPPPNADIRYNSRGEAPLPAENVAFLGKSLFTDYLLAVEAGGTLLLVATIGAIAIASRREGRRS